MTESEALTAIRGLAAAGRYAISDHADIQMRKRRVSHRDLRTALIGATAARWQSDKETWRTTGPDVDGDDLTVALVIDDGLLIVTVFLPKDMPMNRCPTCKSPKMKHGMFTYRLSLDAGERDGVPLIREFSTELEGHRCEACAEVFFKGPELIRFDEMVARWLVENGYESGDELRFVRKAAGLRAAEVAEFLGVSLQTVSAWETGKHAADASTRGTIGALALDAIENRTTTRDRLRAMRAPLRKTTVTFPRVEAPAAE